MLFSDENHDDQSKQIPIEIKNELKRLYIDRKGRKEEKKKEETQTKKFINSNSTLLDKIVLSWL